MAKLKKTLPKEFLDMCNTHSNVWTSEEIDECKQLLNSEPVKLGRVEYNR